MQDAAMLRGGVEGSLALLSPLFELLCGVVVQCAVDGCLQEAPHDLSPIRLQKVFCLLLHAGVHFFLEQMGTDLSAGFKCPIKHIDTQAWLRQQVCT